MCNDNTIWHADMDGEISQGPILDAEWQAISSRWEKEKVFSEDEPHDRLFDFKWSVVIPKHMSNTN